MAHMIRTHQENVNNMKIRYMYLSPMMNEMISSGNIKTGLRCGIPLLWVFRTKDSCWWYSVQQHRNLIEKVVCIHTYLHYLQHFGVRLIYMHAIPHGFHKLVASQYYIIHSSFAEKVIVGKIKMYRHNFIIAIRAVYKGFTYGYFIFSQ